MFLLSPAGTLRTLLALTLSAFCHLSYAQAPSCPPNIGFETGSFTGWQCKTGSVSETGSGNTLQLVNSAPLPDIHTLIQSNLVAGSKDFYGDFPMVPPNGSKYFVQLGNEQVGSRAEQ